MNDENNKIEDSIPGYETCSIPTIEALQGTDGWTTQQWQEEFDRSRNALTHFIRARDGLVILARTAARHMMETLSTKSSEKDYTYLEQVEVEITQAVILMAGKNSHLIPTSPNNFIRFWELLTRHIQSFIRKQPEDGAASEISNILRLSLKAASFLWYVISLWMMEDPRLADYVLACLKDNYLALGHFVNFYTDDDGFDKGYFHRATLTPKIKRLLRSILTEDEQAAGILEYISSYIQE